MSEPPEETPASVCQSCGRRPAVVEFIQVSGDERRQFALCRECAVSHGLSVQLDAFQRLSQLLLHQMRPLGNTVPEEWQAAMGAKCGRCGLAFEDFVRTGLLGCSQCYKDFQEFLTPILRRLHGVTRQTAEELDNASPSIEKRPPDPSRGQLEAELSAALSEENYEKAAAIRDRLKKLGV
jgi:protein arginine kinase activator